MNNAATTTFGNGVNLQPSYYNNGNVTVGWGVMKQHNRIRTVRIEIEPNREIAARAWIQQACSQGYAVIATYHKYRVLGTDRTSELMLAAQWWQQHYRSLLSAPAQHTVRSGETLSGIARLYYGDASKYRRIFDANRSILRDPDLIHANQVLAVPAAARSFTINLMNEWGSHTLTARAYATAYNAAIGVVRNVYDGAVVIDLPGWGQETAVAASAVKAFNTGGVRITDTNIILSAHIYPSAYVQQKRGSSTQRRGWLDRADLDDLGSAGRPCMVGEFGSGGNGQAQWSVLVDHAKSKRWPVLGWAWNGDGGAMNMVTPPWKTNANPPTVSPSAYFQTIYNKL